MRPQPPLTHMMRNRGLKPGRDNCIIRRTTALEKFKLNKGAYLFRCQRLALFKNKTPPNAGATQPFIHQTQYLFHVALHLKNITNFFFRLGNAVFKPRQRTHTYLYSIFAQTLYHLNRSERMNFQGLYAALLKQILYDKPWLTFPHLRKIRF